MSGTTFQNTKPDGSPRAMLGYWRPYWQDVDDAAKTGVDWDARGINYQQGIAGGAYDVPVYRVDEDEPAFEETHCGVLGIETCPQPRNWHGDYGARVRARHANCPRQAREVEPMIVGDGVFEISGTEEPDTEPDTPPGPEEPEWPAPPVEPIPTPTDPPARGCVLGVAIAAAAGTIGAVIGWFLS